MLPEQCGHRAQQLLPALGARRVLLERERRGGGRRLQAAGPLPRRELRADRGRLRGPAARRARPPPRRPRAPQQLRPRRQGGRLLAAPPVHRGGGRAAKVRELERELN